jgi:pimeloyl-ACP methyl ester carboxylesterase
MQVLVEDIRQFGQQIAGGKKFTLVAHDWGGAIAWAFAIAHPEMIDKLVIVNAPHPAVFGRLLRTDPDQQKASQYMLMFRSPEAEAKLSADNYAWLQRVVLNWKTVTDTDRKMYLDAWSQPGALTGGLNYYRANQLGPPAPGSETPKAITSVNPAAFAVKVPTLVIWGEKDTALLTSNLDGLDRYVPDLTIERIPDGSHWVIHEQPERIAKLIREFMNRK